MKNEPRNDRPPLDPMQRLRGVACSVPDRQTQERQRKRVVKRLEELHLGLATRPQRRARWATALAVAAGLTVLMFAVWRLQSAAPLTASTGLRVLQGDLQVANGHVLTVKTGRELSLTEPLEVEAVQSAATLQLPSRAQVHLSASTQAMLSRSYATQGQTLERIQLRSGSVSLTVPPLGRTASLQVATPHALVKVHGTKFQVRLKAGQTHVSVQNGLVSVEFPAGRVLLRPGQEWHSETGFRPPPSASPLPSSPHNAYVADEAAQRHSASKTKTKGKSRPKAPKPPNGPSTLDAQNRMLQGALLAKRSGLRELALSRLQQLIETYPHAEVAHNARVEKFRLLRERGRAEAARKAARDYLAHHPRGFARQEARALVEKP